MRAAAARAARRIVRATATGLAALGVQQLLLGFVFHVFLPLSFCALLVFPVFVACFSMLCLCFLPVVCFLLFRALLVFPVPVCLLRCFLRCS